MEDLLSELKEEVIGLVEEQTGFTVENKLQLKESIQQFDETELNEFKKLLLEMKEEQMKEMKEKIEILKKAALEFKGWNKRNDLNKLKTAEALSSQEDIKGAEEALTNL